MSTSDLSYLTVLRKCSFSQNNERYTHLFNYIKRGHDKNKWKKYKSSINRDSSKSYWSKLEHVIRKIDETEKYEPFAFFSVFKTEVPFSGYAQQHNKDKTNEWRVFFTHNGVNYRLVKKKDIEHIITHFFRTPSLGGYRGRDAIWRRINQAFIGISREHVGKILKQHEIKQLVGGADTQEKRDRRFVAKPNDYWQVDITYFKKTIRNSHYKLLVIVDLFSKFAWTIPLRIKPKTTEVNPIVHSLKDLFMRESPPKYLSCDNEFNTDLLKVMCSKFGVIVKPGTPYKATDQAAVERLHRTIKDGVKRDLYSNRRDVWTTIIKDITFSYNCTPHDSLKVKGVTYCPMRIHRGIDVKQTTSRMVNGDIENAREKALTRTNNLTISENGLSRKINCIDISSVGIATQNYKTKTTSNSTSPKTPRSEDIWSNTLIFPKGSKLCYFDGGDDDNNDNEEYIDIIITGYELVNDQYWYTFKRDSSKKEIIYKERFDVVERKIYETLVNVFDEKKRVDEGKLDDGTFGEKISSYVSWTKGNPYEYFINSANEENKINFHEFITALYFSLDGTNATTRSTTMVNASFIKFDWKNPDSVTIEVNDNVYCVYGDNITALLGKVIFKSNTKITMFITNYNEKITKEEIRTTVWIQPAQTRIDVGTVHSQNAICQSLFFLKQKRTIKAQITNWIKNDKTNCTLRRAYQRLPPHRSRTLFNMFYINRKHEIQKFKMIEKTSNGKNDMITYQPTTIKNITFKSGLASFKAPQKNNVVYFKRTISLFMNFFKTIDSIVQSSARNENDDKIIKTLIIYLLKPIDIESLVKPGKKGSIQQLNLEKCNLFKLNQNNYIAYDELFYFISNVENWWTALHYSSQRGRGGNNVRDNDDVITDIFAQTERKNLLQDLSLHHRQEKIKYKLLKGMKTPNVERITVLRSKESGDVYKFQFIFLSHFKHFQYGNLIVRSQDICLGHIASVKKMPNGRIEVHVIPKMNNVRELSVLTNSFLQTKTDLFIIRSREIQKYDIVRVRNTARTEKSKKIKGTHRDSTPIRVKDAFLRKGKQGIRSADPNKLDPYDIRPTWSRPLYVVIDVGSMFKFSRDEQHRVVFISNSLIQTKKHREVLFTHKSVLSSLEPDDPLRRYLDPFFRNKKNKQKSFPYYPNVNFNKTRKPRYQLAQIKPKVFARYKDVKVRNKIDLNKLRKYSRELVDNFSETLDIMTKGDRRTNIGRQRTNLYRPDLLYVHGDAVWV